MPLAAVYARVSTRDQSDRGFSLPEQIEHGCRYAKELGYSVPDGHILSEDYPGSSLRRPQLTILRDLVREGQIQAVIVFDMDRLSRKLAHQLLLEEEFERACITLHVVTMPNSDKSPEGRMMSTMKGMIAEYEHAKILERTSRGRRGRAKAGHAVYGRGTFGYVYVRDKVGAHYEVHEAEAIIVKRIFAMYLNGASMEAIAEHLTTEGIPTPKEAYRRLHTRLWHQSTVRSILSNESYVGTMYDGKTRNVAGKRNPDRKTRHERLPREEWIPVPVPPIIERQTWETAQSLRQQNRLYSKRHRQHTYLLIHGRLRCGQCGGAMTPEMSEGRKARYRCSNGKRLYRDAVAPHTIRSVMAAQVEPVVWEAIERALNNPEIIANEVQRRHEQVTQGQKGFERERAHYQRQLARCEIEATKTWDAYVDGAISLERFKAIDAEVQVKRQRLEEELKRLDETEASIVETAQQIATLYQYYEKVRTKMHLFTIEEKQLACDALDIHVTWRPGEELEITGNIPLCIVHNSLD